MPITPTYPGIYIQEILSNAHTIQAASTSVTVFMGYTHPFLTPQQNYKQVVEIFSFSDYEREFGGLFSVDWLSDEVGRAVYQFFLNGGTDAFVVALQPQFNILAGGSQPISSPGLTYPDSSSTTGIQFTGLQPVDTSHALTVSITNPRPSDPQSNKNDLTDIVISYGTTTESYRRVTLSNPPPPQDASNTLELRIGTAANPVSALVQVSVPSAATGYPTEWPLAIAPTPLSMTMPSAPFTTYSPADFTQAFMQDNPLDKLPGFNLLATPGVWDPGVVSDGLAFCERKQAFMIVDPPADAVADQTASPPFPMIGAIMSDQVTGMSIPKSANGALYFPFLRSSDPMSGNPLTIAPSGFVTGVIAREDTNRGVWKAPAGLETVINNTTGVAVNGQMADMRQGTLNPIGVNCLRGFPGIGTVVFGARTLVSANPALQQYKYVPVRRMALFLEQSLKTSLMWVVHEPNDVPLWVSIRTTIENFMLGLFNQQAFQGSTPSEAFQVICDSTTTTPDDQANGIVNIVVAFAPLKPAEFVVIKIAQLAGQPQS
jgi:Bacteriophage tail sheath protein